MKLEEFRSALREPAPEPMNVSVDAIVAASRRRRAARRVGGALTGVAAVGGTVAIVLAVSAGVGGKQAGGGTQAASGGGSNPAAGSVSKDGRITSDPVTGLTTAGAGVPRSGALPTETGIQPVGEAVRTGIQVRGGELVFWFGTLKSPTTSGKDVGFQAGVLRSGSGKLASTLLLNEPAARAYSPGFHEVWFGQAAGGGPAWSVVGYYVGPAARITTTVKGREVAAKLGAWNIRPDVHVFWVTPATGQTGTVQQSDVGVLHAYDAAGHKLTDGRPGANETSVG
jgi:hypothetical protein